MRTHLAGPFLVALGAIVSCSHSEPAAVPPPPLATCVVDAWVDVDGSCNCPGALLTTPECSAADCKESNALVLRSDGTSADLLLRRSDTLATFSAIGGAGGVLKGKWALAQDADPARLTQTFDATNKTYETNVRCTQTQLLTSTKSYTRVPAKLGKALATENGTWQGVSYR